MEIKRIRPLSLAKVLGVVYAGVGLVLGLLFALATLFGSTMVAAAADSAEPLVGIFFGVGAVILMPLFYGVLGFLVGLLGGWIYNLAARFVGGVELEVE